MVAQTVLLSLFWPQHRPWHSACQHQGGETVSDNFESLGDVGFPFERIFL